MSFMQTGFLIYASFQRSRVQNSAKLGNYKMPIRLRET